jgi:thiamine biosynthesis protein ThiS
MSDMEIVVNGERRQVEAGTTLAACLRAMGLPQTRIAVEHNGTLVPKERLAAVLLSAGDRLEVVTLVGGG